MSTEAKEKKDINVWFKSVYNVSSVTDEEISNWYEEYQYEGFNRSDILTQLSLLVPDPKEVMQIVMVCALRGPKRAAQVKLHSGRTIESYKIPSSGQKGTKRISCQRITAATADLAAYFLKKANVPKRLNVDCPAWLQFPSAGSITLPDDLRVQHIEFSRKFSEVIGGSFSDQIYQQMMLNSYLEPSLKLFDVSPIKILSSDSSTSSAPRKPPKG